MGKHKKTKPNANNLQENKLIAVDNEDVSYEKKLACVNRIAQPMASKKLAGRIYKLVKKASQQRGYLHDGIKNVHAAIRKGSRGMMVFAGDVSPIEIMCHLPAVCEEKEMPYIYTPSRQDLGTAMGYKRPSIMMLIQRHENYKELYDKVLADINKVPKLF